MKCRIDHDVVDLATVGYSILATRNGTDAAERARQVVQVAVQANRVVVSYDESDPAKSANSLVDVSINALIAAISLGGDIDAALDNAHQTMTELIGIDAYEFMNLGRRLAAEVRSAIGASRG